MAINAQLFSLLHFSCIGFEIQKMPVSCKKRYMQTVIKWDAMMQ